MLRSYVDESAPVNGDGCQLIAWLLPKLLVGRPSFV